MRFLFLGFVFVCLTLVGCGKKDEVTASANVNDEQVLDEGLVCEELAAQIKNVLEDEWDSGWDSSNESFAYLHVAAFSDGDLVPCPDEQAEFVLLVRAMNKDRCFYQWQQAFREYEIGEFDPSDEPGMKPGFTVCAMLVDGFASGDYQYTQFTPDSATIRIDWRASQGDESQDFQGEFRAPADNSGTSEAGNGNVFSWTFLPVK